MSCARPLKAKKGTVRSAWDQQGGKRGNGEQEREKKQHVGALVGFLVLVCFVIVVALGALTAVVLLFSPPPPPPLRWWWSRSSTKTPPYMLTTTPSRRLDVSGGGFQADGVVQAGRDEHREWFRSSKRGLFGFGGGGGGDGGDGEGTGDGTGEVEVEVEAGTGVLTSEESSKALLADGKPRCFTQSGPGMRGSWKVRCLPNVFSIGVSKCGTTSLSNWMAQHPLIRWVPPRPGSVYLEAHVFDASPQIWDTLNPANLRHRLAVEARSGDAVLDYTPHYSVMAETPFRIQALYGNGPLGREGLMFLVVLREPVSRTISSWIYKSDPGKLAEMVATKTPEELQQYSLTHALESRPLDQAVREGMEGATHLAACVSNATASGVFGKEREVVSCEEEQEDECPGEDGPCEKCETETEPWCNPQDLFLEGNLYDAHVGKSMYALQLSRWFSIFGRDKFKVLFTEDMAEDPIGTLEAAMNFLGLDLIDPDGQKGFKNIEECNDVVDVRYNEGDPAKEALLGSQVTPEVLKTLRDFFVPHNKALEELLGEPLPSSWDV